jgi:hypothetical protein
MENESTQDRGEPTGPSLGDLNPQTGKVYMGNGHWEFPAGTGLPAAAFGGCDTSPGTLGSVGGTAAILGGGGGGSGGTAVATGGGGGGGGTLIGMSDQAGKAGQIFKVGVGWVDPPRKNIEEPRFMRIDGTAVTQSEAAEERKAAARELLADEMAAAGKIFANGVWIDAPKVNPCAVTKEQVGLPKEHRNMPPLANYQFAIPANVHEHHGMLMIGNIRWQLRMDPIGEYKQQMDGEMAQRWRAFIKHLISGGVITDYGDGRFDVVMKFNRLTGQADESSVFRAFSMPDYGFASMISVEYQCPLNPSSRQDHVAFCFDTREPDVIRFDANFPGVKSVLISTPAVPDDLAGKAFLFPPCADLLKRYAGIVALVKDKKPYKATIDDTGHLVRTYDEQIATVRSGNYTRGPEVPPMSEDFTLGSFVVPLTGPSLEKGRLAFDGKRYRLPIDGSMFYPDDPESWSRWVEYLRFPAKFFKFIDNEDVITLKWDVNQADRAATRHPDFEMRKYFSCFGLPLEPMLTFTFDHSVTPCDKEGFSHHTVWIELDRDGKDTLSIEFDFQGMRSVDIIVPKYRAPEVVPDPVESTALDCHPNLHVVRPI